MYREFWIQFHRFYFILHDVKPIYEILSKIDDFINNVKSIYETISKIIDFIIILFYLVNIFNLISVM